MIMWLYDMNVRLFLATRSEYDNTALEDYMKTLFKTKDKEIMENTQSCVPTHQATFHKKQHTPHRSYGKPYAEQLKVNLTRADDLVLQTSNANKNFADKSHAAANKPRKGRKDEAVADKKELKKPSGEGRKFYDSNGNEINGKAKNNADTAWLKSTPNNTYNEGGGAW